jgi:rare lipoprotein A
VGGRVTMKGLVVALGLAVLAAAAQAQTSDERFPKPSHENPSLVTALRSWLASKTADKNTAERRTAAENPAPARHAATEARPHHRYREHRYRVHDTDPPKAATMAPAPAPAAPVAAAPPVETPPVETRRHRREREHRYRVHDTDPPKAATMAPAPTPAAPGAAATAPPAETQPIEMPAPAASPAPDPAPLPAAVTASITPSAPPTLASAPENLNMPHPVAIITIKAPRPSVARPHHGRSQCTTGERIITAFYWEGKHTASGARFNPDGMTAAHRTFPFGTRLMVINPRNGRSVTVTVNDRGPFTRGVSLDLSRGAAKTIGLQGNAVVCMARL